MNALGRWQGQTDSPLSAQGREQAQQLGERLAAAELPRFARLVTSDLARAAETATVLGRALGMTPVQEPGLRELDVGEWGGRPHAEIEARWPDEYARFRAGDDHVRPGGAESRALMRGRALAALGRQTSDVGTDPVLVVAHLGLLRSLRPGLKLGNAECFWWADGVTVAASEEKVVL